MTAGSGSTDLQPRAGAMVQYGLAYLGVHLAFMPLLVLLVPRRMEVVAAEEATAMLSWLLLAGAVVAGATNLVAGHAGDGWLARHGTRRGLIGIGVALLGLSYIGLAVAESFAAMLVAIGAFQAALNCVFAPLGALLADHFPHERKGLMGAIMHGAMPASTLAVVAVGVTFPVDTPLAFVSAGALSIACFLPLLMSWKLGSPLAASAVEENAPAASLRSDFAICWLAKLAVQLGATFVNGYIYLYLAATLARDAADPKASATGFLTDLSWPAGLAAVVATLGLGLWSDRAMRRRLPLAATAALSAAGLLLLGTGASLAPIMAGYVLFTVGLSAFTSLDTALVAQLVSGARNRGVLLGVMNLTNTLPSIAAPALTLLAFERDADAALLSQMFLASAALALAAAVGVLFVRTVR